MDYPPSPMQRLIPFGRLLFAAGFVALGIEHFIFRDFITGRAPAWPASVPGRMAWASVSGTVIAATGVSIIAGKRTRIAALLAGLLILLWALLRHIPVVASEALLGGAWTRAGKALVFFGGCLVIAATSPREGSRTTPLLGFINRSDEFIVLGRICLGIFLLITGIQHFMFTELVASLIPAWFPGDPGFWTRFAGVALISGGIGVFIPYTARLAALLAGLMVFSWVWIVHVPRFAMTVSDNISVFEAPAVSGIAFVIAGFLYRQRRGVSG